GACVVEVRRQPALAPRKLAELLSAQGVTVWWARAADLDLLVRKFPRGLESVCLILCEEDWSGLSRLAESLPEEIVRRVYVAYGMAEIGGAGTFYPLRGMSCMGAEHRMEMEHVTAGKRMYLLDSELRGAPEGVVGEIYVGGEEQAWGYGSATQTAECWVPDPWSVTGGGRLYRSGDLARRRKDGSLEQVGRRDRRTLVSGVRVYEQEIEAALGKHEGVKEAAVAISDADINKDNGQKTQITAWVVKSGQGQSQNGTFADELLRGLKEDLPEVMIPQKLVELEELPRAAQGEINRESLLRMLKREGAVREYVPPGTPVEEKLAQVWEQALNRTPIGIHDNFFEIGGDSLLAALLVVRTNAAFQVEVPLRRLFESPTIAQQAGIIVQLKATAEETAQPSSSLIPLHIEEGGETLFCIHSLWGDAYGYRALVDLLPGLSIYAIQSEGLLPSEAIRYTTIESRAAHYVEIIRSVQKSGPYWLLGWSAGGLLALEAARILTRMGEEVAQVVLLDTQAPGLPSREVRDVDMVASMLGRPIAQPGQLEEPANGFDAEYLSKLQGDDLLGYALEQLKRGGRVPQEFSLELARLRLAVGKNNFISAVNYFPEPYSGNVVLLAAEGTPLANADRWKEYVSGQLDVEFMTGQHEQLLTDPFATEVAAQIQKYLDEAKKQGMRATKFQLSR
ncbi:MAG: alpha/beta fold hydrolase, partial [Acidobacteriia bacterium]|nr:alpha/beta fold hydrolase [Terriglobia bacterium]